jgi:hypothetical protein
VTVAHGPSRAPTRETCRTSAPSREILARIAEKLGVPVATFFPDQARQDAAITEAAQLVAAFAAIENPGARRTCLAFVRAMSGC